MLLFIEQEKSDCISALSKFAAAGIRNPFAEIARALRKIDKWSPKSGRISFYYYALSIRDDEVPSCKELCLAVYGSNWTASQEALVRKVITRKEGLPLKRLT